MKNTHGGKAQTHSNFAGANAEFSMTGMWMFSDKEEAQAELFAHIAWLYTKGISLYISEIQTPVFPLVDAHSRNPPPRSMTNGQMA